MFYTSAFAFAASLLQVARAETFLGADKCPSPSPPPEPVPDCVPAGATHFGPDQCTKTKV